MIDEKKHFELRREMYLKYYRNNSSSIHIYAHIVYNKTDRRKLKKIIKKDLFSSFYSFKYSYVKKIIIRNTYNSLHRKHNLDRRNISVRIS